MKSAAMALGLLVVTAILPARARAESPPTGLSPGAAAALSAGLTLTGLGVAALAYNNTLEGLVRTAVIGGGTLLIAPSVGRIAVGEPNAAIWIGSRIVIGGIATAIMLQNTEPHGGDEYGPLKVGIGVAVFGGGALLVDSIADMISTTQIRRDRAVAVTPTMLGRAPGLALTGTF